MTSMRMSVLLLQILDTNPQLFFHLQQQRLIELIRSGKVEEALEFAQEELAPRGEENVSSMFRSFDMKSGFKAEPQTQRAKPRRSLLAIASSSVRHLYDCLVLGRRQVVTELL